MRNDDGLFQVQMRWLRHSSDFDDPNSKAINQRTADDYHKAMPCLSEDTYRSAWG